MTDNPDQLAALLADQISSLTTQSVVRPTLVYFDVIGIAWPIRCLLHLKQVEYDLIQIPITAWAQRDKAGRQLIKPTLQNGHVPLYVDNKVRLGHSNNIMIYLADKYALFGQHQNERYGGWTTSRPARNLPPGFNCLMWHYD